MAKNEAKVKFTAETGDFNKNIKNAKDQMGALSAEMKLNDAQMKATGQTVAGLEQKQKLLTEQHKQQQNVVEALNGKLQKAVECFGENSSEATKLRTQLANAQVAEERIKQAISKCNTELDAQRAAENRVKTETEKLTDTIDEQQTEVNKLKKEYVEAVLKFGDTSDEARDLARKINDLSGELAENKRKVKDASGAADDLDQSFTDAGDSADEASNGGFTVMKGALADLASNAIQAVIGKISEFVGWLRSLPEETRELRQDMGTLTTAFDNVGFSTDTATETWKKLYAIFGEDDRAVEAANNIARMAKNEEELNEWVTITTGIWGTYQDALPVEALAESAGETAKVGKVTGNLADALNWSSEAAVMFADYMSEDVTNAEDAFNEALAECNTEAERQALITDTLTKLYGGAADKYEETAGSIMDANKATADNTLAQSNLADTLEPLNTMWTEMKTELLTGIAPALEKVTEAGMATLEWMKEHPVLTKVIVATLATMTAAITALIVVIGVWTVAQWALNSAILANPITWIIVAIVAAIAAVVAIIIIVIEYWDEIVAAVKKAAQAVIDALSAAWEWVKNLFMSVVTWVWDNVLKPIIDFYVGFYTTIWNGIVAVWNWIVGLLTTVATWVWDNVIAPVIQFFVDLWNGIVSAFHTVIDPWIEIIRRASVLVYNEIIKPVLDFFVQLWADIVAIWQTVSGWFNENVIVPVVNFFKALWNTVSGFFRSLWEDIKTIWSVVSGWFNRTVVQPVANFFKGMWDGLKNGAKAAWDGIKSVFSKVADFFGDIFGKAWNKVKDVFSVGGKIFDGIKEGIASAFKTIVNGIIGGINKVITIPFKAINTALSKIKKVDILGVKPFDWITTFSIPSIPLLAQGGILTKPTLNIAGEAGPEAIIPIEKLQGFMSNALDKSLQMVNMAQLIGAVEDLANRAIELNINGHAFATATASDTDIVNGSRVSLKNRGLAL